MNKFESSIIDGGHKVLVLDGRFALHEYKGSFQDKSLTGMAIYGYDLQHNQWQSVLIDSFHMSTGIMFLQGTY